LSNPEKHRHLTVLNGDFSYGLTMTSGPPGSFFLRRGKVFSNIGLQRLDVLVEREYTFDIGFEDGRGVIPTLDRLCVQVAAIIERFRPEFDPSYP